MTLSGFSHDADGNTRTGSGEGNDVNPRTLGNGSTDGFLQTNNHDQPFVQFEYSEDVSIVSSALVRWNTGIVQWLDDSYSATGTAIVRVTDPDMNLNPRTLDKIKVNVSSDSDKAGILVNVIETAEESGIFNAMVSFVQDSVSSGDRLFAVPEDIIHAKYDDRTLPSPHSISDDLKIEDSAEVYSSVIPTERLENSAIFFSDSTGSKLQSFSPDTPMQIVGTVTNDQSFTQKFVYLIQVRNDDNSTESISWIQGEINPAQSLDVSQFWTPKKPGTYRVETFVWEPISDPAVLSASMSAMITVE